jgi:hypothetical protein
VLVIPISIVAFESASNTSVKYWVLIVADLTGLLWCVLGVGYGLLKMMVKF